MDIFGETSLKFLVFSSGIIYFEVLFLCHSQDFHKSSLGGNPIF